MVPGRNPQDGWRLPGDTGGYMILVRRWTRRPEEGDHLLSGSESELRVARTAWRSQRDSGFRRTLCEIVVALGMDSFSLNRRATSELAAFVRDALRRGFLAVVGDEPKERAKGASGGPAEIPPPDNATAPKKGAVKETEWVEIRCVDANGEPHAAAYRLELPDGRVLTGTTQDGSVYVSGIDPGDCKLSFHEIDAAAWKKA